jgi:hypothetical protein
MQNAGERNGEYMQCRCGVMGVMQCGGGWWWVVVGGGGWWWWGGSGEVGGKILLGRMVSEAIDAFGMVVEMKCSLLMATLQTKLQIWVFYVGEIL